MLAVVDTGALFSSVDSDDPDHERTLHVFERRDLRFIVPVFVVAETAFLVGQRLGPLAEARFLAGITDIEVDSPLAGDWGRIAELIETYRDFPLGAVDASVVALAERLDTDLIITFDQRHFRAVRPRHVEAFRLLPE